MSPQQRLKRLFVFMVNTIVPKNENIKPAHSSVLQCNAAIVVATVSATTVSCIRYVNATGVSESRRSPIKLLINAAMQAHVRACIRALKVVIHYRHWRNCR